MTVKRGDVVLVDFPYSSGTGSKLRPALVVQNDKDNARLPTTVVVQITSTTHRTGEPTQVLIDLATADGKLSGLAFDSAVNCINVVTLDHRRVRRRLGQFTAIQMTSVNQALRTAFALD